jgi:uncharacterized protein (DUF2249 family)
MEPRLTITPKTRIRELIDAYPELEETLVMMAPAFSKLKNPVLRNTIARVTSISQAAVIGNVNVTDLVNQLRQSVGQEKLFEESNLNNKTMNQTPSWFSEDKITITIDARPMLEAGHHPINDVFEALGKLETGQILKLITGFVPAPLLDKARDKGHKVHTIEHNPKEFFSYFCKA